MTSYLLGKCGAEPERAVKEEFPLLVPLQLLLSLFFGAAKGTKPEHNLVCGEKRISGISTGPDVFLSVVTVTCRW